MMSDASPRLLHAQQLIEADAALWQGATRHAFLDQVRDGTLPRAAFARWLVQDHHFARALTIAEAEMLRQAPRRDYRLIISGLSAMEQELTWFEEQAARHGLDLAQPLQPACRAYADFLLALAHRPYVAQIVSLWALERAYLEGWQSAQPADDAYHDFVERWTNPAFADYVGALEAAADAAMAEAADAARRAAQDGFRWVARYERDFWQMAFEGE